MESPYVYELIDPRDGQVFYVGKGVRSRMHAHEVEARKGKASPKCDRIREIWGAGQKVTKRIVKHCATDLEAYALEAFRVAEIGRENLTNQRDGGIGGRIKFGVQLLKDEARVLIGCLAMWAHRGAVAKVGLGEYGVLDLHPIMESYGSRLLAIGRKVGFDWLEGEAKSAGLNLVIQNGR